MSFSNVSEKLVNKLIESEHVHAVNVYGDKYYSKEEAYFVLEEEVREAEFEKIQLDLRLREFYKYVFYEHDLPEKFFELAEDIIKHEIKELAQVSAVFRKIKNTLEDKENDN